MSSSIIVALVLQYRYVIFVPLAIAEGTTVSFFAGVLSAIGVLDPFYAFIILVVGDIIPDTLWYQLGRHAHRRDLVTRFGHHIGMTPARLEFLLGLWRRRPVSTLILSKLAYGMGAPMLMSAGYARMPLGVYYGVAIAESCIKYSLLMLLGMSLYNSYESVLPYIHNAELAFTAAIILLLLVTWTASRRARSYLLEEAHTPEA